MSKPKRSKYAPKGSVQVRATKGRLQVVFSHPVQTSDGEMVTKRFYVSTGKPDTPFYRQQAAALASQIQRDIDYGELDLSLKRCKAGASLTTTSQDAIPPISPKTRLDELWEQFTEFQRSQGIQESTLVEDYRKIAKRIAKFPSQFLEDTLEIERFVLAKYSPETAKRTFKSLRQCCNWAMDRGIIEANPFDATVKAIKTRRGKQQTSRKAFTVQERDAILEALESNRYCSKFAPVPHSRYAPMIRLMFLTGCRIEDAVALKWKHIKAETIVFSEAVRTELKIWKDGKTHTTRLFPINAQLRDFLESIRPEKCQPDDLLFPNREGKEINPRNVLRRVWRPVVLALVEAGKVREYLPMKNTRHSWITWMRQAGFTPEDISALCGNSSGVILSNYSASSPDLEIPEF